MLFSYRYGQQQIGDNKNAGKLLAIWIATMADEFVENTLNTNKTQVLPSNYGTFDR